MKINKPQLTISLLASDRPDSLRKCLDSLRPIMDAIPSELILIDTSKNPVVHDMLLEYTDQVYEFEWCQDFAKARNEGLSRAKGEWFLYLDDDEWFVESASLIDFFQSGEYKNYGYANYQVRNFLDEKYTNYSDCWVSRMIRVDEDTHFASKIHEYFTPLRGVRKDLYAMVYHSGYIYKTPEKRKAHFERNSTLLLDMIKEEPYNIRWQTHLVQEYSSMGEWESLEKFCKERLNVVRNSEGVSKNTHIGTFYIGLVHSLLYQNKHEESILACKQALADMQSLELLRAMIHLRLGESYFRLGKWDDALDQVVEYLHILQSINRKSPTVLEQKFIPLVGEAFEENQQKSAYSILICSQLEKGNTKALLEHYDKLGWNQQVIFMIEDIEKYLVKAMWTLPYNPIFMRIIVDAFQNGNLRALFCEAILSIDVPTTNEFQKVLYTFVEAMVRVIAGPQAGNMIGYQSTLQQYVEATCQWYDFLQVQNATKFLEEEIPAYIQAAINISEYIQLESRDKIKALGKLKEAVEVLPDFADGIGSFLHFYSDLDKQREEQQKQEMDALRNQVMGQVKSMLENGQTEAALQIIGQLKQMFPEDLEVASLALEVRVKNQ